MSRTRCTAPGLHRPKWQSVSARAHRPIQQQRSVHTTPHAGAVDAGRRIAAARGVDLQWQEADAEALPYADAEFDAVITCVGVMFARTCGNRTSTVTPPLFADDQQFSVLQEVGVLVDTTSGHEPPSADWVLPDPALTVARQRETSLNNQLANEKPLGRPHSHL